MSKVDEIMEHVNALNSVSMYYATGTASLRDVAKVEDILRTLIEDAVSVPAGWKLVPIEPTDRMLEILAESMDGYVDEENLAYTEMLSALPDYEVES